MFDILRKTSNLKIWIRLVGVIWLILTVAGLGFIYWVSEQQRHAAIEQARDFSTSMHQMTMAGLTGMMITGTVAQRDVFLDQIKQSNNIKELRVIRGENVVNQFGPGKQGERNMDKVERQVLQTGRPYSQVQKTDKGETLRVVMPAIAHKNSLGKNCMMCHAVQEGSVLGAVSMNISLDKVNAAVADFSIKLLAVAVSVGVLAMLFVYIFITRFVTTPLNEMTRGLADIAQGDADLTRRLKIKSRDEIGEAAAVFNLVMEKFSHLVQHVRDSASQVSLASRQLAIHAFQVADSSVRQSEKSGGAAAAVEEMAGSIASVAQTAGEVQLRSQESLERTHRGNESLSALVGEIDQVESAVNDIAKSITEFMQSTGSIAVMTKQVKDIASQTNLLALNAAIEAARAGEQGRGFAVVADEVRKLAEKSAQAASQIDMVTQTLGQQSVGVEKSVEKGLQHLRSSQDSMETVAVVLSEANGAVNLVGQGLNDITSATEEQRLASDEVTANVEAIASMAEENSHAVAQVAKASQHLEQLANELQGVVGHFSISKSK